MLAYEQFLKARQASTYDVEVCCHCGMPSGAPYGCCMGETIPMETHYASLLVSYAQKWQWSAEDLEDFLAQAKWGRAEANKARREFSSPCEASE